MKQGICQKCQSKWIKVEEYNGRWLCNDNLCLTEEQEKDSGKHLIGEAELDEYRKLVAGTQGILPTSYDAKTIIDYMEYSTDALAQIAYVSNCTTVTSNTISQTGEDTQPGFTWGGYNGNVQRFKVTLPWAITKFTVKLRKVTALVTGTLTGYIYSDNDGTPNTALATFSNIDIATGVTTSIAAYDFTGTFTPTVGTYYYIAVIWTGGGAGHQLEYKWNNSSYADGPEGYSENASGWTWVMNSAYTMYFLLYQDILYLQSYLSTTHIQGTYSLKGVALATNSLNKTLTRTVSPTIDLSNLSQINFYMYCSRGGSNIKISLHNSNGAVIENTPYINFSDAWQNIILGISGISNVNKNSINSIVVTIVDAGSDNTFYLDNMYAE